MRVRDVMTKNPCCCTPDAPLHTVARMMAEHDCGAIPVVGDLFTRKPLGIITDRDIVLRAIAQGHDPMLLTARDCMTSPATTVVEETAISDCVEVMELGQIRRVIIVDDTGGCTGIVAQADLARHTSKRAAGNLERMVSERTEPAFVF